MRSSYCQRPSTYILVTTHVRGVAKGQLRLVILYYGLLKVELPWKSKEAYLYKVETILEQR